MMPIPFQMLPSGITAYLFRFNVPAAITVVWITNPVTWPLILYWQYRFGAWLLGQEGPEGGAGTLLDLAAGVPGPLLLGCAVTGLIAGAGAYSVINALWVAVARRWWQSHERPRPRAADLP
jgi:uncharacterized protein (DUF2062 family)